MACEARVRGIITGGPCRGCLPCRRALEAAQAKRDRRAARFYDRRRRPPLGMRRVVRLYVTPADPGVLPGLPVRLSCGHDGEVTLAQAQLKARVRCPVCSAEREAA